jgi:hypothetical protein
VLPSSLDLLSSTPHDSRLRLKQRVFQADSQVLSRVAYQSHPTASAGGDA